MTLNDLEITNVVQDEEYAKIHYYESLLLIYIEWNRQVTSEQYKDTFNKALKYSDDHKITLFLSDICKRKITAPSDRKWFEEKALPKAVKKGLKKGAVVFDGNPFKKYYLNTIYLRAKMYMLPFKFFTSTEKALEWLQS
ncbi:STAS/SEC14 domain-containing protein [Bacteroidota bacterium]